MTGTETLIRELADRAELADLVARHSLWVDEGRWDETDRLFTEDVVVKSLRGEIDMLTHWAFSGRPALSTSSGMRASMTT